MSAGTPNVRNRHVVTAERCKHKTLFGYQQHAWFTASHTRSISSAGAVLLVPFHFRIIECNLAKLRPSPHTSEAPRPETLVKGCRRSSRPLTIQLHTPSNGK